MALAPLLGTMAPLIFNVKQVFSQGTTTFYSGYTPVSNMAVGAYMYGAGYSSWLMNVIAGTYAATMSSNGGDPDQSLYWNVGHDLAAGGLSPSCTP